MLYYDRQPLRVVTIEQFVIKTSQRYFGSKLYLYGQLLALKGIYSSFYFVTIQFTIVLNHY